ncbi:hypothetical protein ACWEPL_50155 [Nonomuraea sp. NPDC004186]
MHDAVRMEGEVESAGDGSDALARPASLRAELVVPNALMPRLPQP